MRGIYGAGREEMPRVMHISIARYRPELPRPGETLTFLVAIHEEGTGITWQQNVEVDRETEERLLEATLDLHRWSLNLALTPAKAQETADEIGSLLYDTFIGPEGVKVLRSVEPTAVLLDVDETILNLPWELIGGQHGPISQETPFGRLVTTRTIPRQGRDPLQEDTTVRILAVANPTSDLGATEAVISVLKGLEGTHIGFCVEVDELAEGEATRPRFADMVGDGDYDMIHFAGHGYLDPTSPGLSALRFADGDLTADQVLRLPWKAPPYIVFNSACESGRAVGSQRLVSGASQANGLAAAFLSAGVYAYAGYFWPVTDAGAGMFATVFYRSLFECLNVGQAFRDARRWVVSELGEVSDLTGYSAILFGDAASKERRDLMTAA